MADPGLSKKAGLPERPSFLDPDLLKIGSSVYSVVQLVAFKNYDRKTNKAFMDIEGVKGKKIKVEVPFVPVMEVTFSLRGTSPQSFMKTIVEFSPKIYLIEVFEKKLFEEWVRDPVEEWIRNLMLQEELRVDEKEAKKEEKKKLPVLSWVISIRDSFKKWSKQRDEYVKKMNKYVAGDIRLSQALSKLEEDLYGESWNLYEISKKEFGMYTW